MTKNRLFDIDFDGKTAVRLLIDENEPIVIVAVDGYGNQIDKRKIAITEFNKQQ